MILDMVQFGAGAIFLMFYMVGDAIILQHRLMLSEELTYIIKLLPLILAILLTLNNHSSKNTVFRVFGVCITIFVFLGPLYFSHLNTGRWTCTTETCIAPGFYTVGIITGILYFVLIVWGIKRVIDLIISHKSLNQLNHE